MWQIDWVWAEAWHLIEGKIRPSPDHQIIVRKEAAVLELDPVLLWINLARPLLQIADALAPHHLVKIDLDTGGIPTHGPQPLP
jgi:hypothetical protein